MVQVTEKGTGSAGRFKLSSLEERERLPAPSLMVEGVFGAKTLNVLFGLGKGRMFSELRLREGVAALVEVV